MSILKDIDCLVVGLEKVDNEISRAENGVLNKIIEMKKRGRVYAK